jgi:hypothetical protein
MIPTETLPDALAADLHEKFIADAPLADFAETRVLLKVETPDLPSPRLVFTCGDPRRVQGQDNTARIPFSIEYTYPMDRDVPDDHRTAAGLVAAWILSVKSSKRRALLASRVYLHDLYTLHPIPARPTAEREATTTIRGEAVVTMAEVEIT